MPTGYYKSSKRTDETILNMINAASENKDCAVFVAHNINSNMALSMTKQRLLKMFNLISKLGLKYYKSS